MTTKMIRVEMVSRDAFWRRAVITEWQHQFPDRAVATEAGDVYVIDEAWLDDFARVAKQCLSTVHPAPADPSRRRLFRRLLAPGASR